MLNIGIIIAAGVLVIYIIMGPLVILGIYAFFDRMAEKAENPEGSGMRKNQLPEDKDPALWTDRDVRGYIKRQRRRRAEDRPGGSKRL